jgi:hypothetical protein
MRNGAPQFFLQNLLHRDVAQVSELVDRKPQQLLGPEVAMVASLLSMPQTERWPIELLTSPVKLKHGQYPREFRQRSFI